MNNIRKANTGDLQKINTLLYEVQKVHSDVRPDLFKSGAKKYTDEQLKDIIKNDMTPVFVFETDGTILGYAFCIFRQELNSNSLTPIKTLYIDDLCVDEHARGEHIGTKLYDFVKNYAKEAGCYNVTLNVWADNKNAVKFYQSIGMKIQKIGMEEILSCRKNGDTVRSQEVL